MKIKNTSAYLNIFERISPSLPLIETAAQPMAMLCGEIIFPAPTPKEFAATIQYGSAWIA